MKVKLVAISVGLLLTASMTLSIVKTVTDATNASPSKYTRIIDSENTDYKSVFLFEF